jgi:hypothetical protein
MAAIRAGVGRRDGPDHHEYTNGLGDPVDCSLADCIGHQSAPKDLSSSDLHRNTNHRIVETQSKQAPADRAAQASVSDRTDLASVRSLIGKQPADPASAGPHRNAMWESRPHDQTFILTDLPQILKIEIGTAIEGKYRAGRWLAGGSDRDKRSFKRFNPGGPSPL